jgi:hypothetical protein
MGFINLIGAGFNPAPIIIERISLVQPVILKFTSSQDYSYAGKLFRF